MRPDDPITEAQSADTRRLDVRSTAELVALMNREDASVPAVVAGAAADVTVVVDAVVERLAAGGRLVYAGAGTSGHIAAGDAAECEATFSTAPGQVVAAVTRDDAEEDDREAGARAVRALGVAAADAFVAVSASGRTPYVLGAAEAAAAAHAFTAAVVSAPESPLAGLVEREIRVVVGPELIAGSTRLKAGTAQKLVLNAISTVAMVRLGKVFDNLMVDVGNGNDKLRARARRVVVAATGVAEADAEAALAAADGRAKVAILALLAGLDPRSAHRRLDDADGDLRAALEGAGRR